MKKKSEISECPHKNIKYEGGFAVCQDCGLILDENIEFGEDFSGASNFLSQSQRDYERRIKIEDRKATQDPIIKHKYQKIKTLEKWFRDYKSSFTEQRKTIELLKSYEIGLNIDQAKYLQIKKRYLRYN
ncbi:MAG: hypothetical protein EU548_01615, partial [Promethearchaeota archaeon]